MIHADLILLNGNIITMNSKQPKAQAVAIKNGRFVAVGTNTQVLAYAGKNTRKIDLKEKTAVPGFIDAHVHGASLGRCLSQTNLRNAKSIKEIQQKIKKWAAKTPKGKWIIGRGWDQDRFAERRYPIRYDLDKVAPNHPVFLIRVCGHLGVVNSKAMKVVGISRNTEPPKGGRIDRDQETGEPNGVLRENALNLVLDALPKPSEEDMQEICLLASKKMVEEGLTTVHWIIGSAAELRALQRLKKRKTLQLRIYTLIPVELLDNVVELGLLTGFGNDDIKIGGVKILADGSLGARTAALKQPYCDAPEAKGMLLYPQGQFERIVEKTHRAGLQLAIHAIGDRTIEVALKTLEKVFGENPKMSHRHRLEHVSVLNPKLIKKMKKLGVVASVQPHFIVSDFWITERLGKARARWAYAFKSLLEAGVPVMGGSDAPVELVSPILGIYALVARETFRQERLTIEEALRLYTANAAYGSFEENVKGSIEEGKLADLVVLSKDPYKTALEQIRSIKVETTIVGGNIVYVRKQ